MRHHMVLLPLALTFSLFTLPVRGQVGKGVPALVVPARSRNIPQSAVLDLDGSRPTLKQKRPFPLEVISREDQEQVYKEIREKYKSDAVRPWEESRHLGRFDPRDLMARRSSQQTRAIKTPSISQVESSDSVQLAWENHFAVADSASDVSAATAVVTDKAGNVYVTGYSDSLTGYVDIVTIKYNQAGNLLWQRRYAGPAHNLDYPSSIALDSSGNVIVAGSTVSPTTLYDYIVIKYNSNGVLQWVRQYNGPDSDYDLCTCVGVDAAGNIYAGGGSFSHANFYDFATVKYAPDGTQLWVRTYNGPLGYDDGIYALTVEPSGEAAVTGMSNSITGGADIVTIKYSPDGVEEWNSRYDDPRHHAEYPNAITRDDSGNIYSTGCSVDTVIGVILPTIYQDYVTIKYSSAGIQEWVADYDGPIHEDDQAFAIGVDPDGGGIYIGGGSQGRIIDDHYSVCILKYLGDGSQAWALRDGRAKAVYALARDQFGNIVSTGQDEWGRSFTVKTNPSGTEVWSTWYPAVRSLGTAPAALAIDTSGSVTIAGSIQDTTFKFMTLGYSIDGIERWLREYKGYGECSDGVFAMAVDRHGNIYDGISTPSNAVIVKYATDGSELWRQPIPKATPHGIGLDSLGYVYVFAETYPSPGTNVLAKYDSVGHRLWTTNFDSGNVFRAIQLAVDAGGKIYVLWNTAARVAAAKFTSQGEEQWDAQYPNLVGVAIAIDHTGAALVTGYASANYIMTVRYSATGQMEWDRRIDDGVPYGIACDDSNNVYVAGISHNQGVTIKYDQSGSTIWTAYGPSWESRAVAPDGNGGAYVGGNPSAFAHFSPSGQTLWASQTGDYGLIQCMVLDSCGNIYGTGPALENLLIRTVPTVLTLKYAPDGRELWRSRYHGFGIWNTAGQIGLDAAGNVYVGGESESGLGFGDYSGTTLKYQQVASLQSSADSIFYGNVETGCVKRDTVVISSSVCLPPSLMSALTSDSAFSVSPADQHSSTNPHYVITFAPKVNGGKAGTITFDYPPCIHPVIVAVNGAGATSRPQYQPASIPFDTVSIGCASRQSITITNPRCSQLALSSVSSDLADFTSSTDLQLIAGLGSTELHVTFAPLSVGVKLGHIVVSANNGVDTILVSGTGVGSGSEIVVQDSPGTGWQLISLPVLSSCPWVEPHSFAYSGSYVLQETLQVGRGYWNNRPSAGIFFAGDTLLSDTIALNQNWNLVGSLSKPFAATLAGSIPPGIIHSPFFGYSGIGYLPADSLMPAHGYWVKLAQAGSIILNPAAKVSRKEARNGTLLSEASYLDLTDATGIRRRVYFRTQGLSAGNNELPPPFQESFDARFESNHFIETLSPGDGVPHRIKISNAEFPVTIQWETKEIDQVNLIVDNRSIQLSHSGKSVITNPNALIALSSAGKGVLPKAFALRQNYPNPFNPTTRIDYELPERSKVHLSIYNLLGQEIQTIHDETEDAGYRSIDWNPSKGGGHDLASGIYFIRLNAASASHPDRTYTETRKVLLIR